MAIVFRSMARLAIAGSLALVVLLLPQTSGAQTGKLYSWGAFSRKATDGDAPQTVAGVPGTVVQISASNSDTYALTSAGTVWAWGGEAHGALGDDTVASSYDRTPVEVQFPAGVTIASLPSPMPFDTGMAIDTSGNVWGWGDGGIALCATKHNLKVPVMITAPALAGNVTLASGAYNHALYYTSAGTLYACGGGTDGQLGDGNLANSTAPVEVTGLPASQVTSVQSSWKDSGVLLADGTYWDWGFNTGGQLGDGATSQSDVPVEVSLPAAVDTVALGGSLSSNGQTVAILSDGSVYSWGNDADGQVGIGSFHSRETVPVKVAVPAGQTFVSVASGGAAEYAIDASGNVWAWGYNAEGQLGIGTTKNESSPVSVGLDASQLSSTAFNVAALGSSS